MSQPILPGATVGILGSGQLGRMSALAARRMGYRVHTLSPGRDTPTGQVADHEAVAAYDDLDAVAAFARGVDVLTFEFENVPAGTTDCCEGIVPVRPAGRVLHVCQHRLREKRFLYDNGFPVTPYREIPDRAALDAAVAALGLPAVLKTTGFGYDGKGQVVVRRHDELDTAWASLDSGEAVLEQLVDFAGEVSVIVARGPDGSMADWGLVANDHRDHILDVSVPDASVPSAVHDRAVSVARGIVTALDVIGVLCVEFFLRPDGELLVNELAPRPHNSGHFSFDASVTSQFEQHIRAVCGLPLGSTALLAPAAMANLLGDVWSGGTPDWAAALADPQIKLHLYGKQQPRPGRKMGHLVATGADRDDARRRVLAARHALTP